MEESVRGSDRIVIELELDPHVHFALHQNAVSIIKRLALRNDGEAEIADLRVEVSLGTGLAAPWHCRLERLAPGATHHLDPVDVALDGGALRAQTERERTELRVTVAAGDGDERHDVATLVRPVEVFAFREWPGLRSLPDLLASFVLPNARAVQDVLVAAAEPLRESTGSGAIDGYQSRDPARVRAIAASIFAALRAVEIEYSNPPASFEEQGQRVRLPGDVCDQRLGTCLDLTLLYAALLEQAGLHPLCVLVEGHAFAGCWLVPETFSVGALDDGLRLRKRVDLDEIVLVETTLATNDHPGDFERAVRAARSRLDDLGTFRIAVDVVQARRLGIRPLPLREQDAADAGASVARRATLAPVELPGSVVPPAGERAPGAVPADPESRLDRWRRKLLDLTYRNRLIAFRETNRTIPIEAPDVAALEDAMSGGARFALLSLPDRGPRDEALERARDGGESATRFLLEELGSRRLFTPLPKTQLDRRLLETWRYARTAFEESGVHVLHLAVGTLVYYESSSSQTERRAPILLLPVRIERESATAGFRVLLGDDEPQVNVTLLEKLRAEFPVDVRGLDEIVEDENGIDVAKTLERFRRAIRDVDRWDVVDEAWIAPFAFTKFLMWVDLRDRAETLLESPVLRHLVEQPGAAFEPDAAFVAPDELDDTLPPRDVLCPLDADSTQLAAVHAAGEGRSFVLEGPPGTGKSQTITNLVAQCLAAGKRVLFVSEKVAALEVVHRRLERVGLGPFCLELHSSKASKRQVLDQLTAPFEVARTREPDAWERQAARLQELRDELNGYVRALHRPRSFGESVYRATSRLVGLLDAPRVTLSVEDPETLDERWVEERRRAVDRLTTAARVVGPPRAHVFAASDLRTWTPDLPDRLDAALDRAQEAHERLSGAVRELPFPLRADELTRAAFADLVEVCKLMLATPGPERALLVEPGFSGIRERARSWIEDGRQKDALRAHVRQAFDDRVLQLDLDDLRDRLARGMESFWPMSWFRTRGVKKALRGVAKGGHLGSNAELLAHLDQAIDLRARVAALAAPSHEAVAILGARHWAAGDPGDWDALASLLAWADRYRAALARLADALEPATADGVRARAVALVTDDRDALSQGRRDGDALRAVVAAAEAFAARRDELDALLALDPKAAWSAGGTAWLRACGTRLATWRERQRRELEDWCYWRRTRAEAADLGLEPLVAACEDGGVEAERLAPAFERGFREAWLLAIGTREPELGSFHRAEHERKIGRFRELDRESLELAQQVLRARLCARVPSFEVSAADTSELGILQREARKKRRHLPVRRLFEALPNLLPRLKPCVLMSPLSVAQYLSADHSSFDVVVFDEASQITPWDAVGAIARGRSAVVVGDSKQLPPTAFFQAGEEDEAPDEGDIEELESILDECGAAGLRSLRLLWHYRSRHESLIAFSNWHYYDNRLHTFPAPEERSERLGVSLVSVQGGVYDRSRSRTNRREAESVVAEVVERLRRSAGAQSIGVVTFSQAQQALIEDLLDQARREDPALEPFFAEAGDEPVFVKNLENVQGDERDVILFSVCYGPDEAGKVTMNFGPLNTAGGERRLNVAITRARCRVVVHATIRPEQIDLTRTNALGVKHLKTFLDYAARGPEAIAEAVTLQGDAAFDSPFERQVHDALVARGHDVVKQVGCSGYRIDLGVRDPREPGRFLLGIECDGAFYHSARTARDRDRLREAVLEGLGWRLVRVWSTDWWRSPEKQVERLEAAIEAALRESPAPPPKPPVAEAPVEEPPRPSEPATHDAHAPEPYRPVTADTKYGDADAFHGNGASAAIGDVVRRVLAAEAPVASEVLCRRVAAFWDVRTTARVRERVLEVVRRLPEGERPAERAGFLWPAGVEPGKWRGFRTSAAEGEAPRDADEICVEEIANAAAFVLRQQVALPRDALVRETARVLGFARLGSKVEVAMRAGVALLVSRGDGVGEGDTVAVPPG